MRVLKGCHLGTVSRAAKHCGKSHDQQFADVMTGVAGPWIGDIIEGGEKGCPSAHPGREPDAVSGLSEPFCFAFGLIGTRLDRPVESIFFRICL